MNPARAGGWLADTVHASGGRIVARLAARLRDIDLAEEALADAVAAAVTLPAAPDNPAGWLWRVAERAAISRIRKRRPNPGTGPEPASAEPEAPHLPDDRLRLLFVAAHPALAPEARAALILKLLYAMPVDRIEAAFLMTEPAMFQRISRAKARIRETGIGFDHPLPSALPKRTEAILIALDVMHAQAQADATSCGDAARGLADACLDLSGELARLMPDHPGVRAQAAALRFAEARRPARLDPTGRFVPLERQDPRHWSATLIKQAQPHLRAATRAAPRDPRTFQARLQALWCGRISIDQPAPWGAVLALYDDMLTVRDDAFVRLSRAVALGALDRAAEGLESLEPLAGSALGAQQMWHVVRADLLAQLGRTPEAASALATAIALTDRPAERQFLEGQLARLADP